MYSVLDGLDTETVGRRIGASCEEVVEAPVQVVGSITENLPTPQNS
jgi:hypothetical protein